MPTMQRLQDSRATMAALRGHCLVHTEEELQSQFHGRAANRRAGLLLLRRAGCAERRLPRSANASAIALPQTLRPVQFTFPRALAGRSTQPNLSFNRTANGMSPWPRGSVVHHLPRGQGATPSAAG